MQLQRNETYFDAAPTADLKWYAIRLRSNFEQVTTQIFQEKGFSTFLPVYKTRRTWSDRTKEVDVPLFPGYTFCQFDCRFKLPIVSTPGVVSILGSRQTASPVPESEVAAVRALMQSGLPFGQFPFLREGQRVLVERGPLAGAEGHIVRIKGNYQLVISVSLLQRSVSVQIDRECVRPLAEPRPNGRVN